jgi:hypothetical protein
MATSTNAQIGAGVVLSYWDTVASSPAAFAVLGKIRSIAGIGVNKPEVDSTTLDSTAVERIGGLPDGKQVTIVLTTGATNTTMDLIEGWVNGTTAIDFKLAIPSPATETRYFSLILLDWDLGTISPSNLVEVTLQGRITGSVSSTNSHP